MKRFITIVTVILLTANIVTGNQTFLNDISLSELVSRSEIILVVKPAKPFTGNERIPVKGYNLREKKKHIPDFVTGFYNVEILKVLKNINGADLSGKIIKVYPAFTQESLHLHIKYYAEGISKSPIYDTYKTSIEKLPPTGNESGFIIFVSKSWEKKRGVLEFEFYCIDSYESIAALPVIEKSLIQAQ